LTVLAEDKTHEISWVAVVGKMIDIAQKTGLKCRVFTTKNVSSHYHTWKERFPQIPIEGRLGDRNEEEMLLSQSLRLHTEHQTDEIPWNLIGAKNII
jgi:hypothetical protein